METISIYNQIMGWQKENNVYLGDRICFKLRGSMRSGFLTGFDVERHPMQLIVRYVNRFGVPQIASINQNALIVKHETLV